MYRNGSGVLIVSFKSDRMGRYLNQTVTWKAKTGQDKFNEPTYSSSEIAARKQKKRQMVRNAQAEEVISQTTVYTQSAIGLEDQIDGEQVITVSEWIDRDGSIVGYKVFL